MVGQAHLHARARVPAAHDERNHLEIERLDRLAEALRRLQIDRDELLDRKRQMQIALHPLPRVSELRYLPGCPLDYFGT